MMLTRSTVALVVLGLGTLTACDKLAEAVADKAAAAAADAQQAGMTEDDKLGNKLAGYIDCINNTSRRIGDAEDRYLDWVDPKVGITGKRRTSTGCTRSATRARASPASRRPRMPSPTIPRRRGRRRST